MIQVDSRKVKQGDTFIAVKGAVTDGHDYIETAIDNGAEEIIAERGTYNVKTTIVNDTRKYLANYLKEKYKEKLNDIKFIGFTGTNGKTTSCYLIYQLLNKLGLKTAYLGTNGFYLDGNVKELVNTTPDLFDLYEMFNECADNEVKVIVMEVSSQAIEYGRVIGLEFDIAAFTNLTQDHLDFHKTIENYKQAKLKLFNMLSHDRCAIINIDDPHGKDFILEENNNYTYGLNDGHYHITNYELFIDKTIFTIKVNKKEYNITISIPGKYNIYNYLNALIVANLLGYSIEEVIKITPSLKAPNGRFDMIKYKDSVIVVDYAHTPDAVDNIISSVNEYKKGKVITVVGCGGDRDRTKRPIMGQITTSKSDYVIFTNDNPRTEDDKVIMGDITSKLEATNFEVIYNREEAITKGINLLKDKDILLILGKGHENYQIIGKTKTHFDDKEVVQKVVDSLLIKKEN